MLNDAKSESSRGMHTAPSAGARDFGTSELDGNGARASPYNNNNNNAATATATAAARIT